MDNKHLVKTPHLFLSCLCVLSVCVIKPQYIDSVPASWAQQQDVVTDPI